MAVTYLITFQVAPERRDQFLKLLEGVLDAMREEPTFHEAILHRDPGSEDRFMLYETWESHEDVVNVQLRRPYRHAWHEALPIVLERERDITVWEPVRVDRKQEGQNSWRHRRACPGDLDQDGTMPDYRDGRDKPGHDQMGDCHDFCPSYDRKQ
jgi:quinol monooxygenase YgiN